MINKQCILTFDSTHFALSAEKSIEELGYKYQLMATPRSINSRCGFSILLTDVSLEIVLKIKNALKGIVKGIYKRVVSEGVHYYEKIS